MSEPTKEEQSPEELKKEVAELLQFVKNMLSGMLIEMKGANRRHMDASDFTINEFRRLSDALERMAAQFEKHK